MHEDESTYGEHKLAGRRTKHEDDLIAGGLEALLVKTGGSSQRIDGAADRHENGLEL